MNRTVRETTTDLDRRAGERHFEIQDRDQRVRISIGWLTNDAPPDESPHFVPVEHPPVNQGALEPVLDLVTRLHLQPHQIAIA